MTGESKSSGSALTRPLALRRRPDLQYRAQEIDGRRQWAVKDPISLEYFHLRDEEYAILQMLDAKTSLLEIQSRFAQMFAPLQLSLERLQSFLANLYRQGLLLADAGGQGEQLLKRFAKERRADIINRATGILSIRFRGVDPQRLLDWLYPKCRWMFSAGAMLAVLLLVVGAMTLVAVQFDVVMRKMPAFGDYFTAGNIASLAAVLVVVKIVHELGHALTCKHFGGECHELGIMLLVFTPCLYCNVSDAWMLPNKWHRIAISSAGICVEFVLAAICTFLWWFSQPGLPNTLFLNVMVVCSVSTLLFNGNPLLRYDGYYILSDLIQVPNLSAEGSGWLRRTFSRYCLGLRSFEPDRLTNTKRRVVALYAVTSTVYRWVIVLAILWFLRGWLEPYGLAAAVDLITVAAVTGMVLTPLKGVVELVRNPVRRRQVDRRRAGLTFAITVVLLVGLCFIPVPFRVTAAAVLEPIDAQQIYVSVPGTLVEVAQPGTKVKAGDVIGRLINHTLRRELAELTGEKNQLAQRLQNLQSQRANDEAAAAQIPTTRQRLADVTERLRRRTRDAEYLTLTAMRAGTVLPPPAIAAPDTLRGELSSWSGTPLDRRNLGSPMATGTSLCLVGNPDALEAVLIVDQADIDFVQIGQRVRLQLEMFPGEVFEGTIVELAEINVDAVSPILVAAGDVASRIDDRGRQRLLNTSYQARVKLEDQSRTLMLRARGRAKIHVGAQTLGGRLYRFLRQTFHFDA